MSKREPVASMGVTDNLLIGVSDVIRWGDVVTVRGTDIDIAKAVTLGIEHGIAIAERMKKDLESEVGLVVTFPIQFLLSALQDILGSGEAVLERCKP